MTGLAKEYGEGLYELAREEDIRGELHQQLLDIADLLREQPDFIRLLCSRAIERTLRLQAAQDAFGGRVHPYILNFIKLLVEKEHFDAFLDCCRWFHEQYNDDFRVVEAHVASAVPLTEAECAALTARLEEMSGRKVALITSVDPALIGGLRVEMEGKRYDNTIQNKLGRLKYSLQHSL